MDTTPPTSHVVNSLGTSQTSDTFPVSVTLQRPGRPRQCAASGVSAVELWVSVNNGPFSLYQTMNITPTDFGHGDIHVRRARPQHLCIPQHRDRRRRQHREQKQQHDRGQHQRARSEPARDTRSGEQSDVLLGPVPIVEFSGLTPSSYCQRRLHAQLGRHRSRPEQRHSRRLDRSRGHLCRDRWQYAPTLIGQLNAGSPNGNGVYSGSFTYDALGGRSVAHLQLLQRRHR